MGRNGGTDDISRDGSYVRGIGGIVRGMRGGAAVRGRSGGTVMSKSGGTVMGKNGCAVRKGKK